VIKPKGACSIQAPRVKGKTGRVNVSEPLMKASSFQTHRWEAAVSYRTSRCKAAGAGWFPTPTRENTAVPGYRGHPHRSHLARVEHGNPVEVRAHDALGRPTVREAEVRSGNRMAQEAKAGSRKAAGKREMITGFSAGSSV